jgi:hypothetical protein
MFESCRPDCNGRETPAMAFAFEKLHVYQKSVEFADEIFSATEQFPRGYGFLVDQINRASLSTFACHRLLSTTFIAVNRPAVPDLVRWGGKCSTVRGKRTYAGCAGD